MLKKIIQATKKILRQKKMNFQEYLFLKNEIFKIN
jgi:hypothetical protein